MFSWTTAQVPNPIPNHGAGGYPITLQFPPFDKVTGVIAKLTDATGNPVEFFLSDPEHPATSFGQFGVICVIPKQSRQAQHAYSVRIDATWKGKPGTWTWSFSTVSLRGIEASDDRAVAGAINVPSLVHGTVAYGGVRNVETVVLQLAAAKEPLQDAVSDHPRPSSLHGEDRKPTRAPQYPAHSALYGARARSV